MTSKKGQAPAGRDSRFPAGRHLPCSPRIPAHSEVGRYGVCRRRWGLRILLLAVSLIAVPSRLHAQRAEPAPKELLDVGVTEHPDVALPLDLTFVDESGNTQALRRFFESGRPVLLTLNYYKCPMLCTLQLNGLAAALRKMDWTPGKEFEIVTVSINPRETPELARLKKQGYLQEYGQPAAAKGWHFLVSPREQNVQALAGTVGFRYHYDRDSDQYAHAAAAMVCTPDGRVSRYLYGVEFDPQTIRLSLVEAGQGKVGSPLDQVLLFCFHYDASKGRYAPAAMNIMRVGGILTAVAVAVTLIRLKRRERRRAKPVSEAAQT